MASAVSPTISSKLFLLFLQLSLFLCFCSAASGFCNLNDRKALLVLAKDLSLSVSDTGWDLKRNPDCCHVWYGVDCNSDGRVTSLLLDLSTSNQSRIPSSIAGLPYLESLTLLDVTGPIPDALSSLVRLQTLELMGRLTGHIPDSLSRLRSLTYLNLAANLLTGSIPSSLSQLTRLSYLDLSFNQLSGPIPHSLGRLTRLDQLRLIDNRLTGPIPPTLSQLSNISQIDLTRNRLTGSIPSSFGSFVNNPNMNLILAQNRLSGPVPSSLGQAKFNMLELSNNRLTGDVSFLFGRNKTWLESLLLDHNRFKFNFSNVEFPPGLRDLFINNNQIYGSLPKQLGQLAWGTLGLKVNNNHLCGMIPTGRRIKYQSPSAFANNTCLCGIPLPPCK